MEHQVLRNIDLPLYVLAKHGIFIDNFTTLIIEKLSDFIYKHYKNYRHFQKRSRKSPGAGVAASSVSSGVAESSISPYTSLHILNLTKKLLRLKMGFNGGSLMILVSVKVLKSKYISIKI